jgi:cob(I)alamin adenosyltransferase
MGNRLTKIYTRTGDDGSTGLGDGTRVSKASPRIGVIGDIDELNSLMGLLLAVDQTRAFRERLQPVQHLLFDLGGELAIPRARTLEENAVTYLEKLTDEFNGELTPLKEFVLPGGNQAASVCHIARAVCRRCERHIVLLGETEFVNPISRIFLNRLSDLLFVLSRILARQNGGREILWEKESLK